MHEYVALDYVKKCSINCQLLTTPRSIILYKMNTKRTVNLSVMTFRHPEVYPAPDLLKVLEMSSDRRQTNDHRTTESSQSVNHLDCKASDRSIIMNWNTIVLYIRTS